MNSISILKDSTKNQKDNLLLESLNEMEKNNRKEIFSINNSPYKPKKHQSTSRNVLRQKVQKENSLAQSKKKIINKQIEKSENVLDFDKVLDILLNEKKSPKKPKKHFLGIKKHKSEKSIEETKNEKPKIKKKHSLHKHNNDIYNIDNFCSSTMKIVEKKYSFHIECPKYTEIDIDNYTEINEDKSEIEDTDDSAYLQYHNMKEQKEIDFKIKIFAESRQYKKEKKKLKEKNKCDLVISIPLE